MKAKSRDTGWNAESSSSGLARVGFCFGVGNAVEDDLERDQRAVGAERFQRARMQLAEIAEHVLRADLDRAGTSRMQPGRAAGHDLQRLHRRAGRSQHRERIGLGIERIRRGRAGPVPADALRRREAAAHAAGRDELILRPVALENLADLEQRDIGEAAIGIGLRRRDEARQQARPHVGQIGRDRIGEREFGLPAAEQFGRGFAMNDQVTASTMPRAASARLARRVRSWIGVSTGLRGASPRSNGVSGTLSTPTMRTISSTMSALPCTSVRQEGTATFTTGPLPATMKPRWPRMRLHLDQRHLDAGEPLHLGRAGNR